MKRLATLACISMFAAIISCQRSDDNLPAPRSTKATTARELFDRQSHALPNTKSTAATEDIVRPMPIGMAPQWDMAIETPYSDGVAITIPVSSAIGYLATYPCAGHDHGAEHADHAEQNVVVTQKLVVLMPARGGDSLCYVVNIVPYADCDLSNAALAEGFAYGGSFVGFSGFAAYHRLDGSLSHIDSYNKGTVASMALPGDNEAISLVTRNARLFIENRVQTKAGNPLDFDPRSGICAICFQRCGVAVLYGSEIVGSATHCMQCRQYKGNGPASPSRCMCPAPPGTPCRTCGIVNCGINHHPSLGLTCAYCGVMSCTDAIDPRQYPINLQRTLLYNAFTLGYVPTAVLHLMQTGSYAIETNRQGQGDEFYHNLLISSESPTNAVAKVRNHFVSSIRSYKNGNGTYIPTLGEAIHPMVDYFVPLSDRQAALNYYTYISYTNIIQTMPGSINASIQRLYNAIQALPQYPSDAQIIAVFDEWCSGNGT